MSTPASSATKRPNEDPKTLEYQTTHPGNLVIKPSSKNYGPNNTVSNARDELTRYFETHLPRASGGWPMDPQNPWSGHTVAVSLQGSVRTPALLRVADCTHPKNGFGPELVLYVRIPRKTSAPLNLNPGRREDVRYFHVDNAEARRLLCNMKISPFDATTAYNGTAQHHPYVLSMLVSMHAIGDLGTASEGQRNAEGKPTLFTGCGATAYANGGLTVVCLPPLSAELEKCFILMGHSLAVAPASNSSTPDTTTSTSSHDDDAESSTSDDVPLAQQLDAIWGNWKAKSTEAGNQLRACTQELYDLGQHLPRAHASSILSHTIPKLSSHSAAIGTHVLAEVMDHFVGIAAKSTAASAPKKAAQSKTKAASAPPAKPKSILQTSQKSTGSKSAAASSSKAPAASVAKTVSFAPTPKETPAKDDDDDNDSESWDIEDPIPTSKRDRESDDDEEGENSDEEEEEERPTKKKQGKRARHNEGDLKDDDEEDFSDGDPDSDDSESNSGDDSDDDEEAGDSDVSEDEARTAPKKSVANHTGATFLSTASSSATTLATASSSVQQTGPKPLAQAAPTAPTAPTAPAAPAAPAASTAPVFDWKSALNLPVMMPELESLLSPASDLLPGSMAQPFASKLNALKQVVETNTPTPSVGQLLSSIVVDLVHALHGLAERRGSDGAVPMSPEEVVRVRALSSAAERLHTGAHPLVRDALRDLRALEANLVRFRQHSCEVTEGLCRIWAPGGALVPAASSEVANESPGSSTAPEPPEPPAPS